MPNYSIAIDGPSGAGKSTIAKALAQKLNFRYLDTGAIYRTVACHMSLMGISPRDKDGVERLLDDVNIVIEFPEDGRQHMILNGTDVTDELRTPEMSMGASIVSAYPAVREVLLDLQRSVAGMNSVIMDGRDIGTVVLPNADVKIFLTASSLVRARRRCDELQAKGQNVTFREVFEDMEKRDLQDSTRAIAPLRCAEDAVKIDSSEMSVDEVVEAVCAVVREKTGL